MAISALRIDIPGIEQDIYNRHCENSYFSVTSLIRWPGCLGSTRTESGSHAGQTVDGASASFARGIWKHGAGGWQEKDTGIATGNIARIALGLAGSSPNMIWTTRNGGTLWNTTPTGIDVHTLYVASNLGVFKGTLGGSPTTAAWTPYDEGLPDRLNVTDIAVLSVSRAGMPKDSRLGLLLPLGARPSAQGVHPTRATLGEKTAAEARRNGLDPSALWTLAGDEAQLAGIPGCQGKLGSKPQFVYDLGSVAKGSTWRFSAISRLGSRVVGGSTYYLRVK